MSNSIKREQLKENKQWINAHKNQEIIKNGY